VSYVPSVTTLRALQQRGREEPRGHSLELVAFADPKLPGTGSPSSNLGPIVRGPAALEEWQWRSLVGARREVEAIAKLFDGDATRVFVGEQASEERFKSDRAIASARFVHVAAHAIIDDREPALSSLLLGRDGGDGQDGLLQAYEVFDLRLTAELVVLSGCETALGRAVRGEGLVGLVQAFLHSGSRAVSVSLWPVEDLSTAELMASFYVHLTGGMEPAEALRQAKLSRLGGGPTAHPYYWAPFVLVGAATQ
jgi:CHAT domain-containing protein